MKLSIAEKWVKALRSGKYKQGKQSLKTKSERGVVRHCCLGVLCELYNKEHKRKLKIKISTKWEDQIEGKPHTKVFTIGGNSTCLPHTVTSWAGMGCGTGQIIRGDGFGDGCDKYFNLAEINDEVATFKQIADFIEERYEDL